METIQIALGETIAGHFLSPYSRSYVPFLMAALMIALFVMWREQSIALKPHQRLLSSETWLSRSAINDYGLILINALFFLFIFDSLMPNLVKNIDYLHSELTNILPLMAEKSTWWAPLIMAATLFIVDDFIRYISHYCEHRIPFLWELHKVHHSAEVLNFMTAERHHPLAIVLFQLLTGFGVVVVNVLFLLIFGDKISALALLGGNIFWIMSNLIGGALRHSPVWISFGPRVERWLISPAQHQIHHSIDPEHFDRNFGGSLAIWDRMFGTLYVTTSKREHINYGLGDETVHYSSLSQLYVRPLQAIMKRFSQKSVISL